MTATDGGTCAELARAAHQVGVVFERGVHWEQALGVSGVARQRLGELHRRDTECASLPAPVPFSAATAPYDSTYLRMVTMLKITFITCCPMRECIGRSASPLRSHTSAMPPRCSRHIRPSSQRCVGSTSECRWRRCYSGPLVCPSCARCCSCRRSISTTSENLPRTRRPSAHEAPPASRG